MKHKMACSAARLALVALMAATVPQPAFAKDAANCVSPDEAEAFRLRDLQSRLMVAALSCNQLTAYNRFMEHFQPTLVSAGRQLVSYFERTGGGEPALNRHLTALANAAGLSRAEAPEQYCGDTWATFLLLEDEAAGLSTVPAGYTPRVAQCDVPDTALKDAAAPEIAPALPTGAPRATSASTK